MLSYVFKINFSRLLNAIAILQLRARAVYNVYQSF